MTVLLGLLKGEAVPTLFPRLSMQCIFSMRQRNSLIKAVLTGEVQWLEFNAVHGIPLWAAVF